jgi:F-type H+-transporting ATPase subunit delta
VGSATREALAHAVAALAASDGVTLQSGEQLLAAGRAIEGSSGLRAVLADPAVETSRKSELVAAVFGSLDPVALKLLRTIAESRWSTPDEFLEGIEEVGIRAIAKAADDDTRIETELFAFSRVVSSDAGLELALGSKLGDSADRVELVDALLAPDASPATVAIVRHLVQSPRGRRIGELLTHAEDVVADAAGSMVVTVTAASEPAPAQLDRLATLLAAQYGRRPHLNLIVDPRLVGGLRVQLGDEIIDGSIASRLADLRLRLAG